MSKPEAFTSQSISPEAVIQLLNGETLHALQAAGQKITEELNEAQLVASQLQQGSADEVVKALRHILASGDKEKVAQEYPALQEFIDHARPTHLHAPLLRAALLADVPAWLYGEAGSGKSTVAKQMADSLGLPFRAISLGPTTSKSDLMGYRDATGQYHSTGFRSIYDVDGEGGVMLFDEVDNANPSILTTLNHALANDIAEFPEARVGRHPRARFVAAANTIGRGATADYVGRAPIDAATLDRFAFIRMDTDDALEEALVLGTEVDRPSLDIAAGGVPEAREWLGIKRAHQAALAELGIRAIISQRAALYGVRLAEQGVGKEHLLDMLIYKGMSEHDRDKLAHLAGQKLRSVMQALPPAPDASNNENKPSAVPDTEVPSPDNWFTPPEASTNIDVRYIFDQASYPLNRSMLFTREGKLGTDDNKALVALCWHLERRHQRQISSVMDPALFKVIEKEINKGHKKLSVDSLVTKLGNKYLKQMRSVCDQGPDHDDIQAIRRALPSKGPKALSDEVIVTYAKEFVDKYGFWPGRVTLTNYLRHHPEVVTPKDEA